MIATYVGETYLFYEGKLEGWGNTIHAVFYHVKCIPNPSQFHKADISEDAPQSVIQLGNQANRAALPRESFVAETAIDVLVADLNSM